MNIGLVAMSGIRVVNQDLMRVGFSLPGFVERGKVIASLPSLSLLTLAGMTPKRFDVRYVEAGDLDQVSLDTLDFDLAAISTYTARAKDAYLLADRLRDQGTKVVIGGLHATVLPDEALQHCDAVVVGEGELSWERLLDDFERGDLGRVYGPDGREFDLSTAPLPRFDLLDIDRYNRLTVQTQRGCPWRCEFCAASLLLTSKYKMKPVSRVIDEVREIKSIWRRPFIELADDNTFVNKGHSRELVKALAREDVRWFTESDVSLADDTELLRLLRDSGCAQVLIGLESPTANGLSGVELARDWKRRQLDRYLAAVETIQSHGITVNGCFVLGLDGDGPEVFEQVAEFVEQSGLYEVQVTVMTPFPGTPLYRRLLEEGRLLDPHAWEKCTLFDVNYTPKNMSVAELEQGLRSLATRLGSPEASLTRREAFKEQLRDSSQWRRAVSSRPIAPENDHGRSDPT